MTCPATYMVVLSEAPGWRMRIYVSSVRDLVFDHLTSEQVTALDAITSQILTRLEG